MKTSLRIAVSVAAFGTLSGMDGTLQAGQAKSASGAVTYHEHVAPILRKNCETCHRPAGKNVGGLTAPMSLRTYAEARPWARAIATKVEAREMPPWFAEEPRGVFKNEKRLTDDEVRTILAWVKGGAPEGDRSRALPPQAETTEVDNDGWSLGKPDIIVRLPEPYLVKDEDQDVQGTFAVKLTRDVLPQDVTVRAWEFRAGTYSAAQNNAVHHMCGGVHPPGADVTASSQRSGDEGGKELASLGCSAGGAEPFELPEGFGRKLMVGGTVTMGMHYYKPAGPGTAFKNQPEIGFYLARGPVRHIVDTRSIGTRAFEIPPFHSHYPVAAATTLKKDTLVFALWPHAHLRGKTARYTAVYPDGRRELLLDVPRYDQSWQVTYQYREPKLLPKGTRVEVLMHFDNSAVRAAKRGFKPDIPVWFGPRTQDEMMLGFFTYAEIEPTKVVPVTARRQ
ncbi:MAG: c-type cytochrome [Vicinamibacterales bacterium]